MAGRVLRVGFSHRRRHRSRPNGSCRLVFYGATVAGDLHTSLQPDEGILYRVAPPTAPHEVLASSAGLRLPQGWLDDTHVVVAYSSGADNNGVGIVGLDGSLQVLQAEPNAGFVALLPGTK